MIEAATASKPPDAASMELRRTAPWIMFIIFFSVLNETLFNVSTPSIAAQYGLTPSGVSWMLTTFIIFFGIGSVIYGKLSDIYSLKKLIVIGILIYNVGSVLGFVFQSSYALVIFSRAIQGAGASAIPALIMVVVVRYFSIEDRGKVFGILNSTIALAIGVGPVIGGFVSAAYHWSFLFLIPLCTLISIPFFRRSLPEEEVREGKVDVPGAILIGLGVGGMILFFSELRWYWLAAGGGAARLVCYSHPTGQASVHRAFFAAQPTVPQRIDCRFYYFLYGYGYYVCCPAYAERRQRTEYGYDRLGAVS
ncbi:MFS family permease [Paenibacillus sp. PvR052]|nr:MFS family permease [Paenibacillus sp. PvP091]MBP1172030.1 MFS family permease [Paenibacillus sp. PvR098]MBP2438411.1 MFS family permease [Paenibacillus sp. PvP052]